MLEDYNVVNFTIHLDGFEIVIYNKRIRDLNYCLCIFCLHPNLHSPVGPVHNNCLQKLVWSPKCFDEGCINSIFNPVWPILDYFNPNKSLDFWFFKFEFKFLKQSIPDAHPDSSVINILNYFWNIWRIVLRGIFKI